MIAQISADQVSAMERSPDAVLEDAVTWALIPATVVPAIQHVMEHSRIAALETAQISAQILLIVEDVVMHALVSNQHVALALAST
ncbi:hypothetical protein N7493_011735 [Penicillium malachiteum]|uniref:Uncharacterized protein n=1 Tax=Penicillium malachiteum TaxID=1324776 RepID=A0AAD6HAC3_9EURO|nr:hypothetical protein N7493_011735 [Penicillium malachiteum]